MLPLRNHLPGVIPAGVAALCRRRCAFALRGGVSVLSGLMVLILPMPAIGSLLLVVAAYLLADGVLSFAAAAWAAAHYARWRLLLVEAGLGLLLAAAILIAPIETVLAFIYLAAVRVYITGALLLAWAVGLSAPQGRVWLSLTGLASLLWGAGLFVWPATRCCLGSPGSRCCCNCAGTSGLCRCSFGDVEQSNVSPRIHAHDTAGRDGHAAGHSGRHRQRLQADLERQQWFSEGTAQPVVAGGAVTIEGLLADDAFGQAPCAAMRRRRT